MSMGLNAFPKIFVIGTDYIRDIFLEDVEITEKIDGSQFDFGKIDGELICRSKGKIQYTEAPDKLFDVACDYIRSIEDKIPDNTLFYAEYLKSPHHNVLKYDRTPTNNLILFGVSTPGDKFVSDYDTLKQYADKLGIETVPLLFKGRVNSIADIDKLLETDSVLGGVKIEGFVVKNYNRPFLLGGQPIPLMAGKYVSEKFKEQHHEGWTAHHTARGNWETYVSGFRTEARWQKAVQHLNENDELENSPRDIGKLLNEVQRDITEECKEDIKNFLWSHFGREVLSKAIAGFPEWYKRQLLERSNFSGELNETETDNDQGVASVGKNDMGERGNTEA